MPAPVPIALDNSLTVPDVLLVHRVFREPRGPNIWYALADQAGWDDPQPVELGRGTRGIAYRVDRQVLKITGDVTEATGAALVRDRPDPRGHVSRIAGVYRLQGSETLAYAVVQELLDRLDDRDPRDAAWGRLSDLWPAWTRAHGYRPILPDDVLAFVRDTRQAGLDRTAEDEWPVFVRWLAEMACYFAGIGLHYHDFWHKNLMRRGPDYVAIDLGYSASAGRDPAIETLARRYRR